MPYKTIKEPGFPTHVHDHVHVVADKINEKMTKHTKETFSTVKDIFSVGTWNGDEYTEADIDEMIKNFELLSREQNYKVPLKVDFFKDTKKNAHGGQPAVGWITKLRKEGKKLFAQIDNIPKTVKELIDTKAYRQVSAEIIWNMKKGEER